MVGQVLYLVAETAGIRATGIGCFFDDPVHAAFGIASREWQSFTISRWAARLKTDGSSPCLRTT